jgi:uncharacterized protein (DUF1778 family)
MAEIYLDHALPRRTHCPKQRGIPRSLSTLVPEVAHRSVSEFVLESALARADQALADRQSFALNATQWRLFLAALDAPPRPLPELERLLKEPGFFDTGSHQ